MRVSLGSVYLVGISKDLFFLCEERSQLIEIDFGNENQNCLAYQNNLIRVTHYFLAGDLGF